MVHAENGHLINDATDRLIEAGKVEEHFHLAAHTHLSEQEAVHRAIAIAESVAARCSWCTYRVGMPRPR